MINKKFGPEVVLAAGQPHGVIWRIGISAHSIGDKSRQAFPTTVTQVGNDTYLLNAQLNSLFDPKAEKVSQYLLQKL